MNGNAKLSARVVHSSAAPCMQKGHDIVFSDIVAIATL